MDAQQPHTNAERDMIQWQSVNLIFGYWWELCRHYRHWPCYFLGLTSSPSLYAHFGFILIRRTSTVSGTIPAISVSLSLPSRLVSVLLSVSEDEASVSGYTTLSGMTKPRVGESRRTLLLLECEDFVLLTLMLG
jgi:hypothetical protein